MTRNSIVERLLTQGHIVLHMADTILNKRTGYIQNLEDLLRDCQINTHEVILLIGDDSIEFNNTYAQPIITYQPYCNPGTGDINPFFCQTTTMDDYE